MIPADEARVTTITTPSDTEVAMTRVFDAPPERVFDAWTVPEHVTQWMLGPEGWTMPVCEIDLRPGGRWRFVWRKTDGSEMELTGEYHEISRPTRLVHTESWGEQWPETVNTLELFAEEGRTRSVLTMRFPSKEARDQAMETGMEDGMEDSYARLETYLPAMG